MADRAQIASVNINRIKLVLLRIQMWEQNKLINDKFNQYETILQSFNESERKEILEPLTHKLSKVSATSMARIQD